MYALTVNISMMLSERTDVGFRQEFLCLVIDTVKVCAPSLLTAEGWSVRCADWLWLGKGSFILVHSTLLRPRGTHFSQQNLQRIGSWIEMWI